MTKNKKIYEGPEIRIIEPLGRFEIVKKVVTHFIEFEKIRQRKIKPDKIKKLLENIGIGWEIP